MKKKNRLPYIFLCFILLSLGGIGLVFAQASPPPAEQGTASGDETGADTYLVSPTISYQGKLITDGTPFDGSIPMTFRLYNVASSGTPIWTEGPDNIAVQNGLFTKILGEKNTLPVDEFDQELWLEISVDGNLLPRQKLMGAPYAFSLVPGADVSGSIAESNSIVDVLNFGDGTGLVSWSNDGIGVLASSMSDHGLQAQSGGAGLEGSALYARNPNENGIALWAHNDSASSWDASLVTSNDGTGILIKGFGGDGGEDEFRLLNDGTIETKADSTFFIPGTAMVSASDQPAFRHIYNQNGSISIFMDSGGGHDVGEWFYLPITIPSVFYGRPVNVEQITIYYRCDNGTYGYIGETTLFKQTTADEGVYLYNDTTDYTSATASSYTWDLNYVLSDSGGPLNLAFYIVINDIYESVTIGGVRVRLGHHSLY